MQNLLYIIVDMINTVFVPLLIAVAFLIFFYQMYVNFFLENKGLLKEEDRRERSRKLFSMIVGFVIIFSFWGIISLLVESTGFAGERRPATPSLPAKDLFNGIDSALDYFGGSTDNNNKPNDPLPTSGNRTGGSDVPDIIAPTTQSSPPPP